MDDATFIEKTLRLPIRLRPGDVRFSDVVKIVQRKGVKLRSVSLLCPLLLLKPFKNAVLVYQETRLKM